MTTTDESTHQDQDKNLAKNLKAVEDMVLQQDGMIKDLVRLIRMQNSEINTILELQSKQAKAQEQEQRRLSEIVDKLNCNLTSFLESQLPKTPAADSEDEGKQSQSKEYDSTLIASLTAKVDSVDWAMRDHVQAHEEVLQDRINKLEAKMNGIQSQISSNDPSHSSEAPTNQLNMEELQCLTETIAQRQISMQSCITDLTETVNRINITDDAKSSAQPQNEKMGPSNNDPGSKISKVTDSEDDLTKLKSRSVYNSPRHHHRIPSDVTNQNTPMSVVDSHDSTGHTLTSRSSEYANSLQSVHRQTTSLVIRSTKQDASLASHAKDILNLKRRLAHAEKLIGACYHPGSFKIRGTSLYEDAAALRYIATDTIARDTFKRFYGNRLHSVYYVDMAPTAVIEAFDMIARVRCSNEMWTDSNIDVKQQIRAVVEKIVDDWVKTLPLRDDDEHSHFSARELHTLFNNLKILCRQANIELGRFL